MKLIEKSKTRIAFTTDMGESMANALRRSVNEIDILAVDEVEFHKNDSVLNDQILAHRIGLLPLKYVHAKESNPLQLKLTAIGPKTVYADELGKDAVVYPDMPIVILEKEQELKLVAYAKMGKGIEHVKYSPGHVYYRHLYDIELKKDADKARMFLEDKRAILVEKLGKEKYRYDLSESLIDALKKEFRDSIEIAEAQELIFFIESFGQLDANKIFAEALDILKKNLDDVKKA